MGKIDTDLKFRLFKIQIKLLHKLQENVKTDGKLVYIISLFSSWHFYNEFTLAALLLTVCLSFF